MIPNYSSIRMLSKEETDRILTTLDPDEQRARWIRPLILIASAMVAAGVMMWVWL